MRSFSICNIDMKASTQTVLQRLEPVWGKYKAYHIHNVKGIDFQKQYEEAAEGLGTIRLCHPVNDKSTKFSKSRDVKYDPSIYHYFASNTRQPLHSDYAYYHETESPDWLMLYCIKPSEYGGKTHLFSTDSLISILKKYDPSLLEDIQTEVTWKYTGVDGDKIHKKPILDGSRINWNYWQIKKELNTVEVMRIREEFFTFLENVIVGGNMYDFSKTWSPGDCIIFNDKYNLHGRDAFLGDRWLKDHAFYEKKEMS